MTDTALPPRRQRAGRWRLSVLSGLSLALALTPLVTSACSSTDPDTIAAGDDFDRHVRVPLGDAAQVTTWSEGPCEESDSAPDEIVILGADIEADMDAAEVTERLAKTIAIVESVDGGLRLQENSDEPIGWQGGAEVSEKGGTRIGLIHQLSPQKAPDGWSPRCAPRERPFEK